VDEATAAWLTPALLIPHSTQVLPQDNGIANPPRRMAELQKILA
jgi:hypothetical protein